MQKTDRLLRLPQILGQKEITSEQAKLNRLSGKGSKTPRPYIKPIVPISNSAWWAGVKAGKYPQPIKLGSRTTAWKESDIIEMISHSDEEC